MAEEYHRYRATRLRVQSSPAAQPSVACCARIDERHTGGAGFGKVLRSKCALRPRRLQRTRWLFALLTWLSILPITTWAEQLPLRLYTTEDGLWSGFINHIMRDSRGFLWFCTRDGLSRFDGYRFTNYRIGSGWSYPTSMIETHSGVYWISLNGGGLYRYEARIASAAPSVRSRPDRL